MEASLRKAEMEKEGPGARGWKQGAGGRVSELEGDKTAQFSPLSPKAL